jgi:hypothetical protein
MLIARYGHLVFVVFRLQAKPAGFVSRVVVLAYLERNFFGDASGDIMLLSETWLKAIRPASIFFPPRAGEYIVSGHFGFSLLVV